MLKIIVLAARERTVSVRVVALYRDLAIHVLNVDVLYRLTRNVYADYAKDRIHTFRNPSSTYLLAYKSNLV